MWFEILLFWMAAFNVVYGIQRMDVFFVLDGVLFFWAGLRFVVYEETKRKCKALKNEVKVLRRHIEELQRGG